VNDQPAGNQLEVVNELQVESLQKVAPDPEVHQLEGSQQQEDEAGSKASCV
jgi:hypothetical protein